MYKYVTHIDDSSLTENVEYLVLNVYDTMENFDHKVDNDRHPKNI